MRKNYYAFVIGTGASVTTFAYKLQAAGMKVAIADCRDHGGTCSLKVCIPKSTHR